MALYNPASITVQQPSSQVATHTAVDAAITTTPLLAVNLNRKGATLYNNSTARAYVKLGASASTTDYTFPLEAGGYYETPYGYDGAISAIWTAANGKMLVASFE